MAISARKKEEIIGLSMLWGKESRGKAGECNSVCTGILVHSGRANQLARGKEG